MVIEILIVLVFWTLIGLVIGYFTGIQWYWVSVITIGLLILYDSLVTQADSNDTISRGQNNQGRY